MMKLSELRPCDNCGGQITPQFYVLRVSIAIFNQDACNQVLGLTMMFGGINRPGAIQLAEVMGARTDEAVTVAGDKEPKLWTEVWLCRDCCQLKDVNLGELLEKRNRAITETDESNERPAA